MSFRSVSTILVAVDGRGTLFLLNLLISASIEPRDIGNLNLLCGFTQGLLNLHSND